jgi:hypothetical protein
MGFEDILKPQPPDHGRNCCIQIYYYLSNIKTRRGEKAIRYPVLTHHHVNDVNGARALAAKGALISSSRQATGNILLHRCRRLIACATTNCGSRELVAGLHTLGATPHMCAGGHGTGPAPIQPLVDTQEKK